MTIRNLNLLKFCLMYYKSSKNFLLLYFITLKIIIIKSISHTKKKFLLIILIANTFLFPLNAKTIKYDLDGNSSKIGFTVKHKITKDVYGEFLKSNGEVIFNNQNNQILEVKARIDVNSIDTGKSKRDRHLRSTDFFDAENHPFIYFESTKIEKIHDFEYKVLGILTMRGVKKEIILEGKRKISSDESGLIFQATSIINRQDFGISWNKPFQKIAGMMVSDNVKIILAIKMTKI